MSEGKDFGAVLDYIDANAERIVADLQELCRQPSISTTNVGVLEMAALLEARVARSGLETTLHETGGNPILTARLKGRGEKTLLFYNHYDVQPAEPLSEWSSPPFDAEVVDGHVIARGATDNKGNIMSRLAAFEAFLAVRGELPCTVKYIIEGEEEVGSPSLEPFVKENADLLAADGCVWEDNTTRVDIPVLSLGNKGLCYMELTCRTANVDFHSSNAQIYENAAWRMTWALSTMKDQNENVLVEGFYDDVLPITEIEDELIRRVPPYNGAERLEKFELRKFLLDLKDEDLPRRHLANPTFNIAGFDGGYTGEGVKTIVSARARAKVDCRLVPNQDPYKIRDCVRAHLDKHGFRGHRRGASLHLLSGEERPRGRGRQGVQRRVAEALRGGRHYRSVRQREHADLDCPQASGDAAVFHRGGPHYLAHAQREREPENRRLDRRGQVDGRDM